MWGEDRGKDGYLYFIKFSIIKIHMQHFQYLEKIIIFWLLYFSGGPVHEIHAQGCVSLSPSLHPL